MVAAKQPGGSPRSNQHNANAAGAAPGCATSATTAQGTFEGKEPSQFSSQRSGAKTTRLTRQEQKLFELQQKQYREQLAKLHRARRVTWMAIVGSVLALLEVCALLCSACALRDV